MGFSSHFAEIAFISQTRDEATVSVVFWNEPRGEK
jgi:hypothetical protein